MTWRIAALALGVVLLAVTGCAMPAASARSDSSPRVRCLSQPSPAEGEAGAQPALGTRPLFFLFCIQSP